MPIGRTMTMLDEAIVRAAPQQVFEVVKLVEHWPAYLKHYRFVRFQSRNRDGGGVVEMSANRPFGPLNWPTWWLSHMAVNDAERSVRFRHIDGITTGMDVEWVCGPHAEGTHVRLFHVWDGPDWPVIRVPAAVVVIGPIFVHGIASRTIAGLKAECERRA